jgi:hypothetical protein
MKTSRIQLTAFGSIWNNRLIAKTFVFDDAIGSKVSLNTGTPQT